ncbi:MAG: hypothetical protein RIR97_590 [Pseudomonadota bacterium]
MTLSFHQAISILTGYGLKRGERMTSAPVDDSEPVKSSRLGIAGWMLFDWAAQPFFTVITTFVFGVYFVSRLTDDPQAAQLAWSNTATISSLLIAIFSPILGSIADAAGPRKPWIAGFAIVQVVSMAMLWFAVPGSPIIYPIIFIILGTLAAEFSIVFNDSMMVRIVSRRHVGLVSNIAWGMGYTGGIIMLIFVVGFLAASPETGLTLLGMKPLFGLDPATGADARITGPLSALWYIIFLLPMFLFTPDAGGGKPLLVAIRSGLADIATTLRQLRQRPALSQFLIGRMLYQDGLNALIVLGGTFAALLFHWATIEVGIFGIILTVVAIFGCIIAGFLDSALGSKVMIMISLAMLIVATIGFVSTQTDSTLFGLIPLSTDDSGELFGTAAEKAYILYGLLVGLAFGPVQASSRSYLSRSVHPDESGRYFGIYSLTGRATSFLATAGFSLVTALSGSAHLGMASLLVFLCSGFFILMKTPYPAQDSNQH